jgi:hypothetical protein
MTDHTGFEADLGVLKTMANQTMPGVADTINTASAPLPSLTISGDVFAAAQGGGSMTARYNDVLTELNTALTTLADWVSSAAGRLQGIADNYQRIDDSLAGK